MTQCRKCKYSLEGLDGATCPECGFSNSPDAIFDLERRRKRRETAVASTIIVLMVLTCAFTSPIGFLNVGSPFGYYGDLNRTKWRIDAIDGVDVIDVKANYDLTVEEMFFEVLIDDTHRARIDIAQGSIWQKFAAVDAWEENVLPELRTSGSDSNASRPQTE